MTVKEFCKALDKGNALETTGKEIDYKFIVCNFMPFTKHEVEGLQELENDFDDFISEEEEEW